jgi:hypothetical protein
MYKRRAEWLIKCREPQRLILRFRQAAGPRLSIDYIA